jgi:hypothetical protein
MRWDAPRPGNSMREPLLNSLAQSRQEDKASPHVLKAYISHRSVHTIAFPSAIYEREPGSSVSIVSGYGMDNRVIEVRSPAEAKGSFL